MSCKLFIIPRSYAERDCTHYRFSDDIAHSLGSIFDALESVCDSEQACEKRREVAHAVTSMLELWMNSYFANRRECVERAFCSCNRDAARHGLWAWAVAEMARFVCKAIRCDRIGTLVGSKIFFSHFQFYNGSKTSEVDPRKPFSDKEFGTGSEGRQRRRGLRLSFHRLSGVRVQVHDGGIQVDFGSVHRRGKVATNDEMGLSTQKIICHVVNLNGGFL